MLKRPAIFFDRDNTLIVSDGYLGDPAKVMLVDGAADAVAKARQYGFRVITISNQSGVARGMFDEDAVRAVNRRLEELLQLNNSSAVIDAHEYCPYHPEATVERYRQDSPLRKPKPGMILAAAQRFSLDLSRSWVIGDAPRDIEAGKAAGCRTVLFRDPKLKASPAADEQSAVEPDFVCSSLKEAVDLIAREAFRTPIKRSPARNDKALRQEGPRDADPAAAPETPEARPSRAEAVSATSADTTAPAPPQSATPAEPGQPPSVAATPRPSHAQAADDELDEDDPLLPPPPARTTGSGGRTELLLSQILAEMRRRADAAADFSVPRLLYVITQLLVPAFLVIAYFGRTESATHSALLTALVFQTMTIALIMWSRRGE